MGSYTGLKVGQLMRLTAPEYQFGKFPRSVGGNLMPKKIRDSSYQLREWDTFVSFHKSMIVCPYGHLPSHNYCDVRLSADH
jgi:hypothetical protein